jgi:hypothetical protein
MPATASTDRLIESLLPGVIEIQLGSRSRVRVDNDVYADALRRVLSVLSER